MGIVIANAMLATILIVFSGCAVVGIIVLRGVAEMLDQVLGAVNSVRSAADVQDARLLAHENPVD